jgi:hypothetical protein
MWSLLEHSVVTVAAEIIAGTGFKATVRTDGIVGKHNSGI